MDKKFISIFIFILVAGCISLTPRVDTPTEVKITIEQEAAECENATCMCMVQEKRQRYIWWLCEGNVYNSTLGEKCEYIGGTSGLVPVCTGGYECCEKGTHDHWHRRCRYCKVKVGTDWCGYDGNFDLATSDEGSAKDDRGCKNKCKSWRYYGCKNKVWYHSCTHPWPQGMGIDSILIPIPVRRWFFTFYVYRCPEPHEYKTDLLMQGKYSMFCPADLGDPTAGGVRVYNPCKCKKLKYVSYVCRNPAGKTKYYFNCKEYYEQTLQGGWMYKFSPCNSSNMKQLIESPYKTLPLFMIGQGPRIDAFENATAVCKPIPKNAVDITVGNTTFNPESLTMLLGGRVCWRNEDYKNHTLIIDGSIRLNLTTEECLNLSQGTHTIKDEYTEETSYVTVTSDDAYIYLYNDSFSPASTIINENNKINLVNLFEEQRKINITYDNETTGTIISLEKMGEIGDTATYCPSCLCPGCVGPYILKEEKTNITGSFFVLSNDKTVEVKGSGFSKNKVAIGLSDEVCFKNTDSINHTLNVSQRIGKNITFIMEKVVFPGETCCWSPGIGTYIIKNNITLSELTLYVGNINMKYIVKIQDTSYLPPAVAVPDRTKICFLNPTHKDRELEAEKAGGSETLIVNSGETNCDYIATPVREQPYLIKDKTTKANVSIFVYTGEKKYINVSILGPYPNLIEIEKPFEICFLNIDTQAHKLNLSGRRLDGQPVGAWEAEVEPGESACAPEIKNLGLYIFQDSVIGGNITGNMTVIYNKKEGEGKWYYYITENNIYPEIIRAYSNETICWKNFDTKTHDFANYTIVIKEGGKDFYPAGLGIVTNTEMKLVNEDNRPHCIHYIDVDLPLFNSSYIRAGDKKCTTLLEAGGEYNLAALPTGEYNFSIITDESQPITVYDADGKASTRIGPNDKSPRAVVKKYGVLPASLTSGQEECWVNVSIGMRSILDTTNNATSTMIVNYPPTYDIPVGLGPATIGLPGAAGGVMGPNNLNLLALWVAGDITENTLRKLRWYIHNKAIPALLLSFKGDSIVNILDISTTESYTIVSGSNVTWNNTDTIAHTLDKKGKWNGEAPDPIILNSGAHIERKEIEEGEYNLTDDLGFEIGVKVENKDVDINISLVPFYPKSGEGREVCFVNSGELTRELTIHSFEEIINVPASGSKTWTPKMPGLGINVYEMFVDGIYVANISVHNETYKVPVPLPQEQPTVTTLLERRYTDAFGGITIINNEITPRRLVYGGPTGTELHIFTGKGEWQWTGISNGRHKVFDDGIQRKSVWSSGSVETTNATQPPNFDSCTYVNGAEPEVEKTYNIEASCVVPNNEPADDGKCGKEVEYIFPTPSLPLPTGGVVTSCWTDNVITQHDPGANIVNRHAGVEEQTSSSCKFKINITCNERVPPDGGGNCKVSATAHLKYKRHYTDLTCEKEFKYNFPHVCSATYNGMIKKNSNVTYSDDTTEIKVNGVVVANKTDAYLSLTTGENTINLKAKKKVYTPNEKIKGGVSIDHIYQCYEGTNMTYEFYYGNNIDLSELPSNIYNMIEVLGEETLTFRNPTASSKKVKLRYNYANESLIVGPYQTICWAPPEETPNLGKNIIIEDSNPEIGNFTFTYKREGETLNISLANFTFTEEFVKTSPKSEVCFNNFDDKLRKLNATPEWDGETEFDIPAKGSNCWNPEVGTYIIGDIVTGAKVEIVSYTDNLYIEITYRVFEPESMILRPGNRLCFYNQDDITHTITRLRYWRCNNTDTYIIPDGETCKNKDICFGYHCAGYCTKYCYKRRVGDKCWNKISCGTQWGSCPGDCGRKCPCHEHWDYTCDRSNCRTPSLASWCGNPYGCCRCNVWRGGWECKKGQRSFLYEGIGACVQEGGETYTLTPGELECMSYELPVGSYIFEDSVTKKRLNVNVSECTGKETIEIAKKLSNYYQPQYKYTPPIKPSTGYTYDILHDYNEYGPTTPAVLTSEIGLSLSNPKERQCAIDQLINIKKHCPDKWEGGQRKGRCLATLAIDEGDEKWLDTIIKAVRNTDCGGGVKCEVDLIGQSLLINKYNTCDMKEIWEKKINFSKKAMYGYKIPSIILYFGMMNGTDVGPAGCDWNDKTLQDVYKYFYEYWIPQLAGAGVIGLAQYCMQEGKCGPWNQNATTKEFYPYGLMDSSGSAKVLPDAKAYWEWFGNCGDYFYGGKNVIGLVWSEEETNSTMCDPSRIMALYEEARCYVEGASR